MANDDLDKSRKELQELRELEYDWDDYNSPPIDEEYINEAERFVEAYFKHSGRYQTVPKRIAPSGDDGVSVMYEEKMDGYRVQCTIAFDPDEKLFFWVNIVPNNLTKEASIKEREQRWKELRSQGKWGHTTFGIEILRSEQQELFNLLDSSLDRSDRQWQRTDINSW